jgi:ribonucleoside-diphosphate reductase subunit M1
MHFYGWKRGLKTGIYYLRTKPSAQAIQFTIDAGTLKRKFPLLRLVTTNSHTEAKANAAASKTPIAAPSPVESLVAPMRQVTIATTSVPVPPAVTAASTARSARSDTSPGPSEEEEISYEEAKRRADERAEAALQCSIDNKDACMMCSG